VGTSLVRAGVGVITDPRLPHDANLRVSLTMHSAGVVAEGAATLTVEREGALVDQVTAARDVYRRDRAPEAIANKLVEALVHSAMLIAFARNRDAPIADPSAQAAFANQGAAPAMSAIAAPVATTPVQAHPAALAVVPLGKAGAFGKGIHIELLSVGAAQVVSAGGAEGGIGLATAVQFDLGPRWAFRLPIALDVTLAKKPGGFADLSITPGLLHRWRSVADQRWVPYAGGGVKLGSFGAGHELLDLPIVVTSALEIGDHHVGGGSHDPNFEVRLRAAPEVWGGVEYHTSSWFCLNLGATYSWIRLASANVHLIREMVGIRFSF
jgi:hypothetical protein